MNRSHRFNRPSSNTTRARIPPSRKTTEYVVPLKPDYNASDVPRIKHTKETTDNNGDTTKQTIHLPNLPENSTPYQMLDFFREFSDACETMEWTTGDQKFTKVKIQLQGLHKETWNEALDAIGDGRSNDDFRDARYIFYPRPSKSSVTMTPKWTTYGPSRNQQICQPKPFCNTYELQINKSS